MMLIIEFYSIYYILKLQVVYNDLVLPTAFYYRIVP